jgi:hypothetical protein
MTEDLKQPSAELAERLLAEVPYERRLTGVNLQCLQGPTVVDLYSLGAAMRFIHTDELDALRDAVSGATVGYVDPVALSWWLGNQLGDWELARAIDGVVAGTGSYLDAVEPIRALLERRLSQCLAVTGAAA